MKLRLALLSSLALPFPAYAQPAPAEAPAAAKDDSTIVVTGARRRTDDVLGDVSVLSGQELVTQLRPTLGETLSSQPGISTSGSGPNVARPVLRGLSGDRIRILTDGIGSLDVSSSSSDHAVAINPLTADSIEVLHGPAALLYGSSAIGGVVNVVDSRIPRHLPDHDFHVQGIAGYGSAGHEKLANGEVNVALGRGFVAHADANWTDSDDLDTGGYILSKQLRRQAAASADPDVRDLATLKGTLPNSDGRTTEIAGALAYIDGGLNIGASVTRHTAFYGVPIRYSLDPAIESEAAHIDVGQTRYDVRAEAPLSGAFREVKVRGGYSDYNHAEIAEDGTIGSKVFSKGGEVRTDLVQRDTAGGWGGTSGAQYLDIRQHIDGDEQYLPPVQARTLGLFTLQHVDLGKLRVEGGLRFERSKLEASESAVVGNPDLKRDFSTVSASAGATYAIDPRWRVGLNVARSERAPSGEELFANGPHVGNASFEVGNPDLDTEKSVGFEASLRHKSAPLDVSATVYASRFSNYLYQAPTGEIEDDLPVYEVRQGRATYAGIEIQADARLGSMAGIEWGMDAVADATRATIKGFGPAPLIPPLHAQAALTGKRGAVSGRLEVEHDWAQRRAAPNETDTPRFTMVNASLDWQPFRERRDITLSLAANNIFDVEARRSTSLLKDYAPLAGRDLRVTARFSY